MAVNKHQPHVLILPEDDANRQIANGFESAFANRQLQTMAPCGGWRRVLEKFSQDYRARAEANDNIHIVMLIDFDGDVNRIVTARDVIPESLAARTYVIGATTEPEDLRRAKLGTFEEVGLSVAQDCKDKTMHTWQHELLRHNLEEVERMTPLLRAILFP